MGMGVSGSFRELQGHCRNFREFQKGFRLFRGFRDCQGFSKGFQERPRSVLESFREFHRRSRDALEISEAFQEILSVQWISETFQGCSKRFQGVLEGSRSVAGSFTELT